MTDFSESRIEPSSSLFLLADGLFIKAGKSALYPRYLQEPDYAFSNRRYLWKSKKTLFKSIQRLKFNAGYIWSFYSRITKNQFFITAFAATTVEAEGRGIYQSQHVK